MRSAISPLKATLLFAVIIQMHGPAASADCPIDPVAGDSTPPYGKVGNRCEGFLPMFVSGGSRIELLGLHRGDLLLDGINSRKAILRIAARRPAENLAIRATFKGEQIHYQMDTLGLVNGSEFEWTLDLVSTARNNLADLRQFAFLACNRGCRHGPDTMYWPVVLGKKINPGTGRIYAVLRTSVDANGFTVRLRSTSGDGSGAVTRLDTVTFREGVSAAIPLPQVPPGVYDLVVNAKNAHNDDGLVPLMARLMLTAGDE